MPLGNIRNNKSYKIGAGGTEGLDFNPFLPKTQNKTEPLPKTKKNQ